MTEESKKVEHGIAGQVQGAEENILLEVKELKKYFPIRKGFFKTLAGYVKAVDGVNFFIREGETMGLVGESGCGKTTTGRVILRAYEPTSGEVWFKDRQLGRVNVPSLDKHELKGMRQNMQMIFQDPYSSLNPRMTLLQIVGEPLLVNGVARGSELRDRVAELLRVVGLRPEYMIRYPHAFSGGQRQRIGIARALALNPQLIVCDEPVSALDVSVQAQVLNLLQDLQADFDLTYLFVAHDLSVIEHISDRVSVMYVGKLVEMAETEELFGHPLHPYTEALMSAVPKPDPRYQAERIILEGDVADPANTPSGCYFHPRCRYATGLCKEKTPQLRELRPDHYVSCHRAEELNLIGVTAAVITYHDVVVAEPQAEPSRPEAAAVAPGDVQITYIEYDPPGRDLEGEYVQLENKGEVEQDMSGWVLSDLGGHSFTFPEFTLSPGAGVKVWSKKGEDAATDLYWGWGRPIWNNSGDTANLVNGQGEIVSSYTYAP